ncbi:hypothetical protein CUMW_276300 [Citrus unshiu]|uniref:Uncharacterized protein n=1 Tax=Citrus unshiu TaxID=55188 RepID=A0A2H5N162_CITUN|nr:hypothetical protein CUMW_276300 [Citrus unshiu]
MKKVSADKNLLMKDHTRTFVNKGGEIGGMTYDKARNARALALSPVVKALVDPDGALKDIRDLDSISLSDWFLSKGGTQTSILRMWGPVAYALGFIDRNNISARCMLTIFAQFATKTEASLLRMLKGSPDVYLSGPIRRFITDKGGRTGSILGGDAERYFMINLLMEKHMSKDLPCLRKRVMIAHFPDSTPVKQVKHINGHSNRNHRVGIAHFPDSTHVKQVKHVNGHSCLASAAKASSEQ